MFEKRYKIKIKQTIASIVVEQKYLNIAVEEVIKQRKSLELYIKKDPAFQVSLNAYKVKEYAPKIAVEMAKAGQIVGVGPMASVAGAIALFAVEAMVKNGSKYAIFENGGDIAMFIDKSVNVGIYCGEKIKNLALKIKPRNKIIGICTSSGKLGHSLSFGNADSVTIISPNPILADAAATSLCNLIKEPNPSTIVKIINDYLISEIECVIVVIDKYVFMGGNVPEIINTKIPYNLIFC